MPLRICAAVTLLFSPPALECARLTSPADSAFQLYVDQLEHRLAIQHSRPAYVSMLETREPAACTEICVEPVDDGSWDVAGALCHHWRAALLVRRATAQQMLELLGDYSHFSTYYAPQVEWAHAVTAGGPHAVVDMRLREQKTITVVVDSAYAVESALSAPDRGYSFSRSTRIQEVENAGTSRERKLPPGDDDGFLWRLNSYWSFVQVPGGLFIEYEAVSLSRDIPGGLGWLLAPLLETFPRESLRFTLDATGRALAERARESGR